MRPNILKPFAISLILITIISFSACKKETKYGDVEIYIDRAMFESSPEFYYKGNPLQHSSYGDIWVFEANVVEKEATIDYSFYFNGSYFSSIDGTGLPVILIAPEDGDVVSNTNSYELRPTGNSEDPFLIFELIPDDPSEGISGNWVRDDGASYLKFSGSTVYLCNGSSGQEFSGNYDAAAGKATLVEGSTTLTFYITPDGSDKILIEQYVSGDHVGSQYYYSTSEYPCDK
ncbi:MAG: hypothetical protein C0595_02640 [Marinilabiliales bacterium]|nr:MAG: hypothetical protein C0595_02640 [Marinilabiliales bacterium]